MANDCIPLYEDGDRINCIAGTSGVVTGCRFVSPAADKQPGWQALTTSTAGGHVVVARTGAGARALGVAQMDAADGAQLAAYRRLVCPVICGAAVVAGVEVESDSTGRAITLGTGKANGIALSTTTAAGQAVLVALY